LPIRDVRLQAAIIRRAQLLLVHCRLPDGRAFWLLPGGARELGETDAEALAREVREELGVDVRVGAVIYDVPAEPADGAYQRWRTYRCELTGGEPRAQGVDGVAVLDAVTWVELEDEARWPAGVGEDRFLGPQLRRIRDAAEMHDKRGVEHAG
jgi:8-oxo-dGTP diphosphatase